MRDARLIIDELVVDCRCAETEAHRLGDAVARAVASQLRELQAERLREFRCGAAVPSPLHLERVIVRLDSPHGSPVAVARSLREAIDRARRSEHA